MTDHPPPRAARIGDVARLAGVSTATVSRALSTPAMVSETTRRAVLDAVAATGYSANVSARNLRRRRTGSVTALVPGLANPFFSGILAGMAETLGPRGLDLVVADTALGDPACPRLAGQADRSRADGLLVLDGRIDPALLSRPRCPPAVQVCETVPGAAGPRVLADNAAGAADAVAHLAGLGHARIGRLAGPDANSLTEARAAGYRAAMEARGLQIRPDWQLRGDFTLEAGAAAAARLLALPERPTALVCDNDEMACGLLAALRARGLDIPRDISVTGFDDIDIARHVTPPLTTIHQPRRDIGRQAARALIALIDTKRPQPDTTLPVHLVKRESTARP